MNKQNIKAFLSKEIMSQLDGSIESIMREIAFNHDNNIDWDSLYKVFIKSMPEFNLYKDRSKENKK